MKAAKLEFPSKVGADAIASIGPDGRFQTYWKREGDVNSVFFHREEVEKLWDWLAARYGFKQAPRPQWERDVTACEFAAKLVIPDVGRAIVRMDELNADVTFSWSALRTDGSSRSGDGVSSVAVAKQQAENYLTGEDDDGE